MVHRVTLGQRVAWVFVVVVGLTGTGLGAATPVMAQGDPLAPPPTTDDYYVPPGYAPAPQPPGQPQQDPQAQPYPAPQTQPYPAPAQAQPYPQQPYAQPYPQQPYQQPGAQPYRGRRRLERLGRGEEVPAGVEVIERRRLVLSFVGIGIFAGSYLLPAAVMIDGPLDSRRTLVPVFGVLLENAHSDYLLGGSWGLALLDAAAQTIGLTLFALGMRKQRYAVLYVDTARGRTLAFAPDIGPRGLGLNLTF